MFGAHSDPRRAPPPAGFPASHLQTVWPEVYLGSVVAAFFPHPLLFLRAPKARPPYSCRGSQFRGERQEPSVVTPASPVGKVSESNAPLRDRDRLHCKTPVSHPERSRRSGGTAARAPLGLLFQAWNHLHKQGKGEGTPVFLVLCPGCPTAVVWAEGSPLFSARPPPHTHTQDLAWEQWDEDGVRKADIPLQVGGNLCPGACGHPVSLAVGSRVHTPLSFASGPE